MAADGSQKGIGGEPAPVGARDPLVAASLLSRIPVPIDPQAAAGRMAAAVWAYPLVGAVLGALAGGVLAGLSAAGLPSGLAAAAALTAGALATGAMHEDGLADCADGIGGGWSRERRLEIMKDSRVGAYGVLALILSSLARWSALAALAGESPGATIAALAACGACSRAPLGAIMRWVPNARAGPGLSASVGRPPVASAGLALSLGLVIPAVLHGWLGLAAALAALPAAGLMALFAWRKLGGQTGDVLGAAQVLGEIAALTALLAVL